jgi:hypothetical protein
MNFFRFTIFSLTFGILSALSAQNPSQSERMVYNLMESGILKTYKDYRSETEKYARLFKARESTYTLEQQIEMQSSYERTAEAFEDFIYSIRNDLLDRKRRRVIKKDAEAYVTQRLGELNTVYGEYFQKRLQPTYTSIVEGQDAIASYGRRIVIPEIPIALIAPVTKATLDIINYIDQRNEKDLNDLKALLEKEWVEPNRFRTWEEM